MLKQLCTVFILFLSLLLTGCIDNPAVHPSRPPYLNTDPHGVPRYPGPNSTPVFPDKAIFYPDGTVYCPAQHYYYRYGRDYQRLYIYRFSNFRRSGKSIADMYCNHNYLY